MECPQSRRNGPVRSQGGFVQLASRLSRLADADPKAVKRRLDAYFTTVLTRPCRGTRGDSLPFRQE